MMRTSDLYPGAPPSYFPKTQSPLVDCSSILVMPKCRGCGCTQVLTAFQKFQKLSTVPTAHVSLNTPQFLAYDYHF